MININQNLIYALVIIKHIDDEQGYYYPARTVYPKPIKISEISKAHNIPFDSASKAAQGLRKIGVLESVQGFKGGYVLRKSLYDISYNEVLMGVKHRCAVVKHQPSPMAAAALDVLVNAMTNIRVSEITYEMEQQEINKFKGVKK